MKLGRLIIAAAALLAIAIPSGVLATHSPNDGPKHDFAVGGGITGAPFFTRFGFAAQTTPNGDFHGHGTFNTDVPETNRQGHVTCLRIEGNRAVFEIRDSDTGAPFGFLAQDRGEPVAGMPVDRIQGRTPNNCTGPALPEPSVGFTLFRGNITIHDGTD